MGNSKNLETVKKIAIGEINLQEEIKWALVGVMKIQDQFTEAVELIDELENTLQALDDIDWAREVRRDLQGLALAKIKQFKENND